MGATEEVCMRRMPMPPPLAFIADPPAPVRLSTRFQHEINVISTRLNLAKAMRRNNQKPFSQIQPKLKLENLIA